MKIRDTLICTDACTSATCGFSSKLTPRFDASNRTPLVDFGGSDAILKASDYKAFPDLLMLPSLAAAVVPVYNIPELVGTSNKTGPLILSRQNMADIFSGEIRMWSDVRIAANNHNLDLLQIIQPIRVVVRTDSSGTSEIFTAALSSFDPKGLESPDYSFASVIGVSSNPAWCGPVTDEIQIIEIGGCNSILPGAQNLIHMKVVNGYNLLKDLTFHCNATINDLKVAFGSSSPGPNLNVTVSKITTNGVNMYTIGYWDTQTIGKKWYKPSIISFPNGTSVDIQTLQEGGYYNSHFNRTYFTTPHIESIWISPSADAFNYNLSFHINRTNQLYTTTLNSKSTAISLMDTINMAFRGVVSLVTMNQSTPTAWIEYRITFTALHLSSFKVVSLNPKYNGLAYITTFLDYNNYPLFYDYKNPSGYGGSGRYTCYMRKYSYKPWSYYTGALSGGVIAEVFTSPYSIGYTVLVDAQISSLSIASIINRAGATVAPSADTVAYAIMDQGGNLDKKNNAVLADGYSVTVWPISGFTYYVIRMDHHIGSCARRTAAMAYLYNYYYSPTVKQMANSLGTQNV